MRRQGCYRFLWRKLELLPQFSADAKTCRVVTYFVQNSILGIFRLVFIFRGGEDKAKVIIQFPAWAGSGHRRPGCGWPVRLLSLWPTITSFPCPWRATLCRLF